MLQSDNTVTIGPGNSDFQLHGAETRDVEVDLKLKLEMAEERARSAAKGWLTRAGRKLESLVEEAEAAGGLEWKAEAITALDDFKTKLNAFDDAQSKVEAVIEEEKLGDDIEKAAVFRDTFSKVRAKIEVLLSDVERRQNSSADIKLPSAQT